MRRRGAFRTTTLALALLTAASVAATPQSLAKDRASARQANGIQSDDTKAIELLRHHLGSLFRKFAALTPGAGGVADNAPNLIVDVPDPVGSGTEDLQAPPPPPTEEPEENQDREKGSQTGDAPTESGYVLIL
jgi:hypothetical protein